MTAPVPRVERPRVRMDTGEYVDLSPVLARAGEGTVYGVLQRPELAAKVFHPTLKGRDTKLEKVSAMVGSTPAGATQPNGFVVLTWPSHVISDGRDPVGFVMPRINTATSVEIHTMSNPANREDPLPSSPQWTRHATWAHLVNTAANLCLAVEVVHRVDAVIGDFQERNILVVDTTEVTLVDCDSMQFTDSTGRRYLCAVGRPEFTAPELAGVDLRSTPREQPADLFALAIHIHQLLMAGNHPFLRGTWSGTGEQPDAITLAKAGDWAGGPGSRLHTHPLAPPVSFLPGEIQDLFARALTAGASDPAMRPTAAQWREALLRIRLTGCPAGAHQIPVETAACPWCVIDDERETRRLRRESLSAGTTGPRPLPRPPARPRDAHTLAAAEKARGAKAPLSTKTKLILAGILASIVIVVVLTTFIVWAILSGVSTFGLG